MSPGTGGVLFSGLWLFSAILAPASRAAVTPVSDARMLQAEVFVLNGSLDQGTAFPVAPMAPFNELVETISSGWCDANGEFAFLSGNAGAQQDSFINPLHMSAIVHATTSAQDACQMDTSYGSARSHFEIGFVTDVSYRFIINSFGNFTDPLVQLGDTSGAQEVLLYDYPGSGPLGYDQVLAPGSYVFRAEAFADEDDSLSSVYAILDFLEVPPTSGAGRVASLTLDKDGGGDLSLAWQPSCSSDDDDYGIYAGDLGMFTSHTSVQCGTLGATSATITPAAGDRYYLVVPADGTEEGSYGTDSDAFERTVGASVCGNQQIASPCP